MTHLSALLAALLLLAACGGPDRLPDTPSPAVLTEKEANLIRLGRSVERGGDPVSAAGLYRQAVAMSQGNVDAHLALSRMHMERKEYDQAEGLLRAAKGFQPKHPEVNLRLGKLAVRRGAAEEALHLFEDGLALLSENPDLLNGKGVALDMMGRHEAAEILYQQALRQDKQGDLAFIRNNLALSYLMTGAYDDAIRLLGKIENVGEIPVLRQNLALAYGLKGDMAAARKWGRKDLSEAQMQENIAFYRDVRAGLRAPSAMPPAVIAAPTLDAEGVAVSAPTLPVTTGDIPPETPPAPAAASPSGVEGSQTR